MNDLDGHRQLADLFVARLTPSRSSTVPLEWIKVVAEQTTAATFKRPHVWIRQTEVLAALVAAGFRVKEGRDGKHHVFIKGLRVDRYTRLVAPKGHSESRG